MKRRESAEVEGCSGARRDDCPSLWFAGSGSRRPSSLAMYPDHIGGDGKATGACRGEEAGLFGGMFINVAGAWSWAGREAGMDECLISLVPHRPAFL